MLIEPVLATASVIGTAISLALGTQIGEESQLYCSSFQSMQCCERIYNASSHQINNLGCLNTNTCPNNMTLACVNGPNAKTPNVRLSPGFSAGIAFASLFWLIAHTATGRMWKHPFSTDETELIAAYPQAHISPQGIDVFVRSALSAFVVVGDILGIIYALTEHNYPHHYDCPDGLTCCNGNGCFSSLSALDPHCPINNQLLCLNGDRLESPHQSISSLALVSGIVCSLSLGAAMLFSSTIISLKCCSSSR